MIPEIAVTLSDAVYSSGHRRWNSHPIVTVRYLVIVMSLFAVCGGGVLFFICEQ